MGNWAWGIGHGELGMGNWEFGIYSQALPRTQVKVNCQLSTVNCQLLIN
ncbi:MULTISPECIES: hypothetical protein [unclassified Microcoleus]